MTRETPMKGCSQPDCQNAIKDHYWGHVKATKWFLQRSGEAWCPDHVPEWVEQWRARRAAS